MGVSSVSHVRCRRKTFTFAISSSDELLSTVPIKLVRREPAFIRGFTVLRHRSTQCDIISEWVQTAQAPPTF